mmetsp:Transcript_33819/g.76004  ORF Transcript_33819/g.76004 Transcript_33819/m.76004 type:complete len:87 (-) Transcript_33819:1478-1738(-)|eukprot:768695-Hanusia_phi.AAC.7
MFMRSQVDKLWLLHRSLLSCVNDGGVWRGVGNISVVVSVLFVSVVCLKIVDMVSFLDSEMEPIDMLSDLDWEVPTFTCVALQHLTM